MKNKIYNICYNNNFETLYLKLFTMNITEFALYLCEFNSTKQSRIISLFNKLLINNDIKITIGTVRGDGKCFLYSIAEQIKNYNMDRLYDDFTTEQISAMFEPSIIKWSEKTIKLNPLEGIDGQCPYLDILVNGYINATSNNVVLINIDNNDNVNYDRFLCYPSSNNDINSDTYYIFSHNGHCYPVFIKSEFARRQIFNILNTTQSLNI